MTGAARRDVLADCAALLTATATGDREAQRIVLDYSDNRAVAGALAAVITAACRALGDDFSGDLADQLRELAWKDMP